MRIKSENPKMTFYLHSLQMHRNSQGSLTYELIQLLIYSNKQKENFHQICQLLEFFIPKSTP